MNINDAIKMSYFNQAIRKSRSGRVIIMYDYDYDHAFEHHEDTLKTIGKADYRDVMGFRDWEPR